MRSSAHGVVTLFVLLALNALCHAESFAVVPMHGQLGTLIGEREKIEDVIDERWLAEILEYCDRQQCDTLIFEIDSLGGYLDSRDQLLDSIHALRRKGTYVIAYVKNALGAATAIPLACDEIHVAPRARFGAASLDRGARWAHEESSIDAHEAAEAAILRGMLNLHNIAPELADALSARGTELWWDPTSGFSNRSTGASSRQLTDTNKVLVLTAGELVEFGIADATFNTVDDLIRDMDDPTLERVDLEPLDRSMRRKRTSLVDRLERDQARCRAELDDLNLRLAAMQEVMDSIEDVAHDQRRTSRERAAALKTLDRRVKALERESRTSIRRLERYAIQVRRTHDNGSSDIEIDQITRCRVGEIEAAVQRDWKRLSRRIDVDDARRAAERVIEQWDDCVADAAVLLSRVPR